METFIDYAQKLNAVHGGVDKRWEHTWVSNDYFGLTNQYQACDATAILNKYGGEGWEVAFNSSLMVGAGVCFKRQAK